MFKTKSRAKILTINPKWKLVAGEAKHLYLFGLKRTPAEVLALIQGRYGPRMRSARGIASDLVKIAANVTGATWNVLHLVRV